MLYHVISFVAGYMAGFLANICIYNIPRNITVIPLEFYCSHCGEKLWPAGFLPFAGCLVPGGKCGACGKGISTRHFLVNLISGFAFLALFYRFGLSGEFLFYCYFSLLLIIVAFIDYDFKIIPNGLVIAGLFGAAAVFIYNVFKPLGIYASRKWWSPLAGILPGSLFLFMVLLLGIIVYRNDNVLGMGDIKLFMPIGIFLGWRICMLALLLSVVSGGIVSLGLILMRLKKRKDTIPFAPFIALSSFISLVWGWDIINWYFSI